MRTDNRPVLAPPLVAILASCIAGCSASPPPDRVEAYVEGIPPEAIVLFFVRERQGTIEQLPFYKFEGTGDFMTRGADWHLSQSTGADLEIDPAKEQSFFTFVQDPGMLTCGVVTRTRRREWFVRWFDSARIESNGVLRFDLATAPPQKILDQDLLSIGIIWGTDEPRFVDDWSGNPEKNAKYISPSWRKDLDIVARGIATAETRLKEAQVDEALLLAAQAIDTLEVYCHERALPRMDVREEIRLAFRSFAKLRDVARFNGISAALDALTDIQMHVAKAANLLK